ncbi:hypothetical protein Tco_1456338 [Tanacetum coccineum]
MANTVFYHLACTALLSFDNLLACLLCIELIIVTIKHVLISQAEPLLSPLSLELEYKVNFIALSVRHPTYHETPSDRVHSPTSTSTTKESSKGKSLAKTSKFGKCVTIEEPVEDPVFEKALDDVEKTLDNKMDSADVLQAYTDPKITNKDWFKDSPKPEVPDPNWNTVKTIDDTPEQPWFNEMVQAEKHPLMFNELMSTPIDFSAYVMNHLKVDNIIREILVGPMFNLIKGTCKSCVELEYNMEECFRALMDQLDWANLEGHERPVDMSKPLPLQDKKGRIVIPSPVVLDYDKDVALIISHWGPQRQQFYRAMINMVEKKAGYGYLKEIVVRQAEYNVYKFKKGDFPDLHLNDIEDMLLLFAQNKLFNLYNDVIVYFIIALKMFTIGIDLKNKVEDVQLGVESYQQKLNLTKPQRTCQHISVKELYTLNYDPPRIIYEDKRKKKRLMIGYNKGIPLREWTEKDKRKKNSHAPCGTILIFDLTAQRDEFCRV